MRRAAICGAIAAALTVAAVAVGAGTDVRIHRLHVPPPPVGDDSGTSVPPAPGKPNPTNPTDPSVPGTSPPAAPPPPGAQPPPPPPEPPPTGITCGTDNVATANINATLSDNMIGLAPAGSVAAAPTLRFRATYPAGISMHNLSLRTPDGPLLCGTSTFGVGGAQTLIVTNLPAGSYQLYCTIHVGFGMVTPFTVTN